LQQATDAILARLIGLALDNGVPDDARKAVIAAADRAGFSVKMSATLEVSAKLDEIVLDNLYILTGGSKAGFRRSVESESDSDSHQPPALAGQAELPPTDDDFGMDAAIVNDAARGRTAVNSTTPTPSHRDTRLIRQTSAQRRESMLSPCQTTRCCRPHRRTTV
jgi:hypothetical protein